MTPQNPVPVSSAQYWLYQFKHLPPSVLVMLNVFFLIVIFVFSRNLPHIPEEWYPGGTKTFPTIQVVVPTLAALPTIPEPPPLPPPEPVTQADPVGNAPIAEQPVAAPVEEPIPMVETPPTADTEATVEAWLLAPPSMPTPSSAPGDPAFGASFQLQPECNLFIGYVGPKRTYCAAVYATQTAEAAQ